MKNTNIDWCTQIPSEWTEIRIKDIALLKSGNTFNPDFLMDGEKYPVYGGNGLRGFTNSFNNVGEHVLIGRQGALCGNINYVDGKFFATEHAIVVYPYKIQETIHWLGETFRSANYNRLSMTAAQPGLAVSVLSNQAIPYPPYNERVVIANYLDEKCSKIDASIAALSEMKEKYLSLKKSLINETVCRGLNKNIPLKSSGIDWMGDIPEHWEVKRFKDYFSDYTTGMTPDSKNENYFSFDGDNTWVSIADLNSRLVDKSSINLSDLAVKAFTPIKVKKGALMFSFKLSIGKIGFAAKDLYTNEAIASLHANRHWNLNYLYYILPKILFGNANENIYGAKMLNQKTMLQMLLIVPPIDEQQSIATYLDTQCSRIDAIVENIDSQIEAYTKLKKSLISEVVTGKKRVI